MNVILLKISKNKEVINRLEVSEVAKFIKGGSSPKILTLGNVQINLAFRLFFHTFGFAEGTHVRK